MSASTLHFNQNHQNRLNHYNQYGLIVILTLYPILLLVSQIFKSTLIARTGGILWALK